MTHSKIKIDVDTVVKQYLNLPQTAQNMTSEGIHFAKSPNSHYTESNRASDIHSKNSILSKYKLSRSSAILTNKESQAESMSITNTASGSGSKKFRWDLNLQDPEFDFVAYYARKKKFVKLYH